MEKSPRFVNGIGGVRGGPLLRPATRGTLYAAAVDTTTGIIIGEPRGSAGNREGQTGDYVALYTNNVLGSRSGVEITTPTTLQTFPTVTSGGVNAPVSYSGIVSSGLLQINVHQKVLVTYAGSSANGTINATSQSGVVLPIN